MDTAGTLGESAALTAAVLAAPTRGGNALAFGGQGTLRDTLHPNARARGSAAQFNPSVSAMSRPAPAQIHPSDRGAADTLF